MNLFFHGFFTVKMKGDDEESQKNYPLNIEPSAPWRLKRPIIAMMIMIFGSAVVGLITLVFSESIYISTITGLCMLLFLIVMVVFYYILRAIEFYNFMRLARAAQFCLIPFRVCEFVLRKIYLHN